MANISENCSNESLRPFIAERISVVRNSTRDIDSEVAQHAQKFKHMSRDEWFGIDQQGVLELNNFCKKLGEVTSKFPLQYPSIREKLTPNSGFRHHLEIMNKYGDLLFDEEFTSIGKTLGSYTRISKSFFSALISMHDMGRNVFNGLSVYHTDRYSHSLEDNLFPNFPSDYLHSVEWITGTKSFPRDIDNLDNAHIVAIVLKVLDSISKYAGNPDLKILRGYTEMYKPGGSFEEWIRENIQSGRLPFKVKKRDELTGKLNDFIVDVNSYRDNEFRLSKIGADFVHKITGKHIDAFTSQVAVDLQALYPGEVARHNSLNQIHVVNEQLQYVSLAG